MRRKTYIGHLIRNSPWITTVIAEKIEAKPGRGKPRTLFMKQVIEDIGIKTYRELKRTISDRDKWRETSNN